MFRIEKNLVNLATARSVQINGEEAAPSPEGMPAHSPASAVQLNEETIKKVRQKAEDVLLEAHDEAASIIMAAREEAENERRSAWQEGFSEGSKEGRRVLEERYDRKMREDDEALKRVLQELDDERERSFASLEDDVVNLALDIVRKIYAPAESEIGGVYESLIRNALRQIAPEGKVIIRVSTGEYERFFSSGSAVFELDRGRTVTASILRDPSLGQADCIIDTEDETVNAGLDSQLKYIKIAFNRADDDFASNS